MKMIKLLFLLVLVSCGAENNIFNRGSKSVADQIGTVLPVETAPDLNILTPTQNSNQGRFIEVKGECLNTKKVEVSNINLAVNPAVTYCTDNKFSIVVEVQTSITLSIVLNVKAINNLKFENKSVKTTVKISPPELSSHINIASIRARSVELNANESSSSDLPLKSYSFEYKKSSDINWIVVESETPSIKIEDLEPSTDYDFRVRAFNGNYSDYSDTFASTMPENTFFEEGIFKAINVGGAQKSSLVAIKGGDFYLNNSLIATLQAGETHKFDSNQYDIVSSESEFFLAGIKKIGNSSSDNQKGNVVWTTQDWASKELNFSVSRSASHRLSIVAFENSSIQILKGSTLVTQLSLAADSGQELTLSSNGAYKIKSSGAVAAYVISTRGQSRIEDPRVILPGASDLLGFPSRWGFISAVEDATVANFFHSNDASTVHNFTNSANYFQISSQGTSSYYRGEALRIKANKNIVANSNADFDGYCSAPFVPRSMLKNTYAVNVDSKWAAFSSVSPGVITVVKPDNSTTTLKLTRAGSNPNSPYKARIENVSEGTIFRSSVLMGAWYEPSTDSYAAKKDETIMFGFNL